MPGQKGCLFLRLWLSRRQEKPRVRLLFGGLIALTLFGAAAAGPLEEGQAAYRHGDYATALLQFRSAADHGNAVAQYNLGRMYFDGQGVLQDFEVAAAWFRRAADQGHAGAQNSLGAIYLAGQGVEQNTAEALRWYRLAADQGYAIAQHNLGSIYFSGQYVPQNLVEAARWFSPAADQGYPGAMLGLAALFEDGQGVPRDNVRALMWYSLAAAHFGAEETDLRTEAEKFRDNLAEKMSSAQIAEAQRQAREWVPK